MLNQRIIANIDWFLIALTILIPALGIITLYSASGGIEADQPYWIKQIVWFAIGLICMLLAIVIDFRVIGNWSYVLHSLICLSLVYISIVSNQDVQRWITFGSVSIQPSEFIKISIVLMVSHYISDKKRLPGGSAFRVLIPILGVSIPFILILKQPDLGTALLLLIIIAPTIILSGIDIRIIIGLGIAGVVLTGVVILTFYVGYYRIDEQNLAQLNQSQFSFNVAASTQELNGQYFMTATALHEALQKEGIIIEDEQRIKQAFFIPLISIILRPYQQKRLVTFINPHKDPLGAGYHVIQSLVAIGSGKFLGKGYGNSTQGGLNFLPTPHTDFIFSILSEEWGFLGAITIIALYIMFIVRGMGIILQSHDRFSCYVSVGFITIISVQVIINIGMVLGLLPVVGIPLPFFSYGGSSMITMMIIGGMLANIKMRQIVI